MNVLSRPISESFAVGTDTDGQPCLLVRDGLLPTAAVSQLAVLLEQTVLRMVG